MKPNHNVLRHCWRSLTGLFLLTVLTGVPLQALADDLLEMYALAVEQDPQFLAARSDQSSVKTGEDIALSRLLPSIGLTGSINRVNNDFDDAPEADDSFSTRDISVDLVQPIYRKDRWLQFDQAGIASDRADWDFVAAEQDLIVRLARAYFDVLSAQDTLTFVLADKKAIARQLEQAKQRFDVGLIAITDVFEAQAAFDSATANQIIAENSLDNAREVLNEIVGQREFTLNELAEDLELSSPVPADLQAWTDKALQENPAVLAARDTVDIAQKEIEVQKTGHYPTVDLVGSYGISRTSADAGTDIDSALLGLQLELPLYTGGGVTAATQQARFDFESAQHNLESQQRAVTRQVRDAYRGVVASISEVKALEATKVSSKSALEATEAGFDVGTRTIVDVLDSQRNLFSTMNDLAQARYFYIVRGLELKQAAGTLVMDDLRLVNAWLEP